MQQTAMSKVEPVSCITFCRDIFLLNYWFTAGAILNKSMHACEVIILCEITSSFAESMQFVAIHAVHSNIHTL